MDFGYIQDNANEIFESIENRCNSLGIQKPELVLVTKSATLEEIQFLLSHYLFQHVAENRVDLFLERKQAILGWNQTPKFHLIGSLQTNKVKKIINEVDYIQSLDRESLAKEIQRQAERENVPFVNCMLEINSGREEAKGGVLPEDAFSLYEKLQNYPRIKIVGMMTMGSQNSESEPISSCFQLTKQLFDNFKRDGLFATDKPILSMGMSGSYLEAINYGANMIRIGRGFFKK